MKPWLLVALAMVHALSLLLSDGVFSGLKKARKCVTGGAVACVVVVSLACNTHYVITAEVVNVSVMDDRPAYPARKNVNFCITDYYNDDDPYHAFVQHVWDSTLKHFLYIHLPFLTLLVLLLVVLGFQLRAGVCAASPPGPVRAPGAKEGSCEMGPVKPDPRPAAAKEEVVDDRSLSEDWPLQGVGASGEAARAGKEEETSDKQADESELKPHNRTHHDGLLHHAGRGDELFAASFRQISGKSLSAAVVALIVLYMLLEAPYSFWPFLCQPGGYIFSPPWTYTPSHETSAAVDSAVTCMAYVNSAVRVFVYIAVDSVFRVRVVNLLSCYRFASASVTFRSPE